MGFPRGPPPLAVIRATILRAGGSAPGVDGFPYELFHPGCQFVAALVGQAFWAAEESAEAVRLVLGENIELLIWIPKMKATRPQTRSAR